MHDLTASQKSILFLLTSFANAGAQSQVVHLAISLQRRGWQVKVVSMMKPTASNLMRLLEGEHIEFASLDVRRGFPDPRAIVRLARLIRHWRPTVVHSHMVHANILARLTRLIIPIPVLICTAHNVNEGARWREYAYGFTERLADITTNVSQAAVDRYIQVGAASATRICFMPNGIDLRPYQVHTLDDRQALRKSLGLADEFVWFAAGRFDAAKDYPNMIHAFSRLSAEHPCFLLIAGKGPLEGEIKKMVVENGLEHRIKFLGIRTDIPNLMNAVDAYVMSSQIEGMPMVLLEAAATGLPIVATDVGGNREVVIKDKGGFLVPANDSLALSAAMIKLMSLSVSQQKEMGKFGQGHVQKNYNLAHVVDLWETMYQGLWMKKGLLTWK